jgi:hypothetical protein
MPRRGEKMQQVEQHVIDQKDARYAVIDAACFASKNLYNAALCIVRLMDATSMRISTARAISYAK